MKKIILLVSAGLIFLTGCQSIDKVIKGEEYVQSSLDKKAASEQLAKLNKADFPQLNPTVTDEDAQVKLITNHGDITITLYPKYAPLAVENFLTHAKEGYYNGLTFHRVIKNFMIQAGDPNGDGTGGQSIWNGKDAKIDSGNGFKNEISPYLYNIRGALSMANAGPDTNGSQFFITQNTDNQAANLPSEYYPKKIISAYQKGGYPALDGQYTVFGQVTEGMDVVDNIANLSTDSKDKPINPVIIKEIAILKDIK